ncbi:MAG: NUDIX hydrolase [Nocardioidaceae bacterium]
MAEAPPIVAAGAVVLRKGPQVLLVHRPKYDDWSFPKGKLDPGEHVTTCAVREVAEETGLDIRLGPPLSRQHYTVRNGGARDKVVHWWTGRAVLGDDIGGFRPNAEVDAVEWVPLDKATDLLTYDRDREMLTELERVRRRSSPLVVVRHGKAVSRKKWQGADPERPLAEEGLFQAEQLVAILGAYGVHRVLSSTSRRCWSTVAPYAEMAGLDLEVTRDLSEEKASPRRVEHRVQRLLEKPEPTVLCTHRPVLPEVYAALGVRPLTLAPGAMAVVHHRGGRVVAVEHHELPATEVAPAG